MNAVLQAHLTFHLSGRRAAASLAPAEPGGVRPALLARHLNLIDLRYDYPLVLFPGGRVEALSGLVDRLRRDVAAGEDGDRLSRHLLRLERRIRHLIAAGARGSLFGLWTLAALEIGVDGDPLLKDSLERARPGLKEDAELIDCDLEASGRLFRHVFEGRQAAKAARVWLDLDRLIHGLSDILRAEMAVSAHGLSPERLRASLGPREEGVFDFSRMSRVLQQTAPSAVLSPERRDRIRWALDVLRHRRFFPPTEPGYAFVFTSCIAALEAWWTRQAEASELVRAIEIARLEIDGTYDTAAHDVVSGRADRHTVDAATLMLPDYFVELAAGDLDLAERSALLDALSAGLPIKVLLRTDDVLDATGAGGTRFGFGAIGRHFVNTAIGLNDVFVLQTPASHLLKQLPAVERGLDYRGPALFSVFSGAGGRNGDLAPYLVAAMALTSRAFPICTYDPTGGDDFAARFSIAGNPEPDADWPVHRLQYETPAHVSAAADLAFTLADFAVCDVRYGGHFAHPEDGAEHGHLIPVADAIAVAPGERRWDRIPVVNVVDHRHRLSRLLVDDILVDQARRCRDLWRTLQELAGLRHRPRRPEVQGAGSPEVQEDGRPEVRKSDGPADSRIPGPPDLQPAGAPDLGADDPYIETPRCSTCNECVQINSRMFGYNENKQAYIVDPSAGTYRQLVEAAESCQVSIIHPGKPRNPQEPGLDELLERAAAFR